MPSRCFIAVAMILVTVLYFAMPARAQWVAEPPSIDPFAQVVRPSVFTDTVPNNGSMQPPPGMYLPGPSNPPFAGPPPVATQGPQFQDAMQFQGPVPTIGGQDAPPIGMKVSESQSLISTGTNSVYRFLDHLEANFVVRGYYLNDQRIVWSGMEETFGAEGIIAPRLRQRCGDFEFLIDSEFYINQPYDRNQLMNNAERWSYAANFRIDPFEVSQLALVTNYEDWTFKIGKFVTPFGRTYFPLYTNSRMDAPYIRTETIRWRETGILAHYKSGYFVGDIALTNGVDNLDTNSSKALVARIGLESDSWAVGCSLKKQDGNGSESQKEFGNHYGVDVMFRNGPFQFSSECIFDEYGFGRPGFDPLNITWVRSIYYRDVSSGQQGVPCTGIGYYANLDYADGPWNTTLNYGEFYPLYSGTAPDQRIQRRGIIKAAYRVAAPLQVFSVLMIENGGYIAQQNESRKPITVLGGFQFTF